MNKNVEWTNTFLSEDEEDFGWPGDNMKDKCIIDYDRPFCEECLEEKDPSEMKGSKCVDCVYLESLKEN